MDALKDIGGQEKLAELLGSDAAQGLDVSATDWRSLTSRRDMFGANILPPAPIKSFFWLCWETIQDPIILLLIAAALVSLVPVTGEHCKDMSHGVPGSEVCKQDHCLGAVTSPPLLCD